MKTWNAEDKLSIEKELLARGCAYIAGVDEVGRGPLAGPVVCAAVIMPLDEGALIEGVDDSKKLSAKRRETLAALIKERAFAYTVYELNEKTIDEINILQATYEAMQHAVEDLDVVPDLLLNDAVTIPLIPIRQVGIVKGDARSLSIAAASIMAKVTRDHMMAEYDKLFPEYGFAKHNGYGTAAHIAALKEIGFTCVTVPVHGERIETAL